MKLYGVLAILAVACGCQAIAGIGDRSEGSQADGGDGSSNTGTGGGGTGGTAAGGETSSGGAATGGAVSDGGSGGTPSATCILTSDCGDGLVCIFATCSVPCREDEDCAFGYRCLDTTAGTACVDATTTCGDGCPGGTVCVGDACRTPCTPPHGGTEAGVDAAASDAAIADATVDAGTACRADQVCVNGGCVGTGETPADAGTDSGTDSHVFVAECELGAAECLDNTARVCVEPGVWMSEECPVLCVQGACETQCDEGETQCSDNIPQTCNAAGTWDDGAECPDACWNGACTACKPPQTRCAAGETSQACTQAGTWETGTACPYVCVDATGECGGVCSPADQRCFADTPQTCSAQGAWVSGTSCGTTGQCDPVTYTCKKFPGETCTSGQECVSSYCRDGRCCEETCTGTCRSCALGGSEGTCLPVLNGPDADSCPGAQACSATGLCKLADGEPCDTNDDCANDSCITFHPDADDDGFGSSVVSVRSCQTTVPAGYVMDNTDCCDSDGDARPGGVPNGGTYRNGTYGWFYTANDCGSFDYDCDEVVEWDISHPECDATCSNAGTFGRCVQNPICGTDVGFYEFDNNSCDLVALGHDLYCK